MLDLLVVRIWFVVIGRVVAGLSDTEEGCRNCDS